MNSDSLGSRKTPAMVMMLSAVCWLKDVCSSQVDLQPLYFHLCTAGIMQGSGGGNSLWEKHNPGLFLRERSCVWQPWWQPLLCVSQHSHVSPGCCTDQGGLNLPAWNSSITGFTDPCSCNQAARRGQGQAAAQTHEQISSAPSETRLSALFIAALEFPHPST